MEDKERTLYCGNLSDRVTEDILYELFLQAGPLESVKIPKDKDGRQRNFGFITFKHPVSVPYCIALMDGLTLYGKAILLNSRNGSETAPNPYKEQLRQYEISLNHQSYNQNDNWRHNNYSRRHDSRRYESRSENDKDRYDSGNSPVVYPGYNQPYLVPQNFPPNQMHGQFFPRSDMYQNQRHYR